MKRGFILFSTVCNQKPIMKGDRFMAINNTSYFLRKSYHYLDAQTALELVYLMEITTVEKGENEKIEPLEYDSREVSLFKLPKEIAKKVLNEKKFRVEFPVNAEKSQEIQDKKINLFSITQEELR
jgi:hypothetical protein